MQPHGTDRLRTSGTKVILHSRLPKPGWNARVPKTNTTVEHPGVAVLMEEEWYEIVAARPLPTGSYEYVLEPWRAENAIRLSTRYDAESEAQRIAAYQTEVLRSRKRRTTNLLGLLAGHLPGAVQEHLGNEYGIMAARLTLMSTLLGWGVFAATVLYTIDRGMKKQPGPPVWLALLAGYLFIDSAVRGYVYFTQSRPMGSLLGTLLYALYYYLAPNRSKLVAPFEGGPGHKLFTLPPPDDVALRDRIETSSAFLTLLSADEQRRLMKRYEWHYRKDATIVACLILLFAAGGAVASGMRMVQQESFLAFVTMVIAGYVAVEQVARLVAFRSGPAGSILGHLARPFVRSLLERG